VDAKAGNVARDAKKIDAQVEDYKTRKHELIMMRTGGELTRQEFEQANADLGAKMLELEERKKVIASQAATVDSFVTFARLHLMDLSKAWQVAGPDQRQRVQNLLFEHGLTYAPESGFSNTSKSSVFNVMQAIGGSELSVVRPERIELPT
jgi:hypothetical protein